MRIRSMEQAWKVALAAIAAIAMAMALYVHLFERRSRQEEDRLAMARLEDALAESRLRLKAEILAELRAELEKGESGAAPNDGPLPNAVLRRGESGGGSALQQVLASGDSREALAGLAESLDSLARQTEESDRALRRNLEELRVEIRRDLDASRKVQSLLLVALIPLVANLLFSIWQPRRWRRGAEGAERERT